MSASRLARLVRPRHAASRSGRWRPAARAAVVLAAAGAVVGTTGAPVAPDGEMRPPAVAGAQDDAR